MNSQKSINKAPTKKCLAFLWWLAILGLAMPVSVAIQNFIAFGGAIMLLVYGFRNNSLHPNIYLYFFFGIVGLFAISELLHDQAFSRMSGLLLILLIFEHIGNSIKINSREALAYLCIGLIIGLVIGLGIDECRRPEYPLWATSGAKYANEAAFLALTSLLLSFTLKSYWRFPVIAFSLIFILMTGAKSTLLALIVSLFVYFLLTHGKKIALWTGLLGMGVITLLATLHLNSTIFNDFQFSIDQPRIDLWTHGVQIAQHDDWLGRGEQQFSVQDMSELSAWLPLGSGYWHQMITELHPSDGVYNISFHNLFVQALVEHGAIGLVALLILFLLPLTHIKASMFPVSKEYAIGIAVWTSFTVHSIFELGLYNATAILVGLIAGLTAIFVEKMEKT